MTTLTAASGSNPLSGQGGIWPAQHRRPGGPAHGGAGFSLTAADILRAVRQRMVMVLFIWLLIVGLTIGVTVLWIQYAPEYRSDAQVKVESVTPGDVALEDKLGTRGLTALEMEALVKDQAVIVTSPGVLQDALESPEVKETTWYRELMLKNDPTLDLVKELDSIIAVTPIPATSFMVVQVSGRNPADLPNITNTVVGKYISKVNEIQKNRFRTEVDRLTKEAGNAKSLLDQQNTNLDNLRAQLPAAVLTGGTNPVNEKLMTLTALRTELEMQKLGRKQLWETLRDMKADEMPVSADMQAALAADPVLADLRSRLDYGRTSLETLASTYGPNHRQSKQMAATVQQLSDRLASATLEKINEYRNQQLDQARNDYYQAQEQEQKLAEQVEQAQAEQRDMDTKIARYMRELEERERLRENHQNLSQQLEYLNQQLRREKSVRISQMSRAEIPKRRHSPQWIINVPIGLGLGLMLAVGLAVLLEVIDTSVRTPRDIQRHIGLPVLSSIPNVDDEEIEIGRIEMASIESPHSVIAETFRQLRTNLFFSAPVEHQGVLLVTSNGAEDGKTTVAVNLAAAIAMSGRKVLLIDANFRRPTMRKFFPAIGEQGLSNVLIGQAKLSDVVVASEVPGLDIVGSGPTPQNPSELLGSSFLRDLIADARSRYDQVIFDGPPVLLVSDALVLAGAVDGVLLVCRFRNTSRGALTRARAQLDAINARILGAVLNAVQTTRGGYFRKHYRAFYDYKSDDEGVVPGKMRLPGESDYPTIGQEEKLAEQIAKENLDSARGDRDEDET